MFFSMNLTEKQILEIKIVLSGKTKTQILNELSIDNSYFSKIEKHPNAKSKLNEYFNNLNPEIDIIIKNLIIGNTNTITEYPENNAINMVNERNPRQQLTESQKLITPEIYIELQDRLLKSQEERLKYLENERSRIIEKYGDVYSK